MLEYVDEVMATLCQEQSSCISEQNRSQVTPRSQEKPLGAGDAIHERSGESLDQGSCSGTRQREAKASDMTKEMVTKLVNIRDKEKNEIKNETRYHSEKNRWRFITKLSIKHHSPALLSSLAILLLVSHFSTSNLILSFIHILLAYCGLDSGLSSEK